MNRSEKTFLAFLAGAAAGVAAGFLFAPAKGEQTRRKISRKAHEIKEDLKENIDKEKIRKFANSAINEVEKYSQRVSEIIN